jgi:hypothetical protein
MTAKPEMRFYYGLARELGMTVGRMLGEMDSQEIAGWMAFFALEEQERKMPKQEDPKLLVSKIKAGMGAFKRGKKSG